MRTIVNKKNGVMITDQTPSYRHFAVKGKRLYRELMDFVKNNEQLKLLFVDSKKRKADKLKEKLNSQLLLSDDGV